MKKILVIVFGVCIFRLMSQLERLVVDADTLLGFIKVMGSKDGVSHLVTTIILIHIAEQRICNPLVIGTFFTLTKLELYMESND